MEDNHIRYDGSTVSLDLRFQIGFMIFDRARKHSFMCVCAYVCVCGVFPDPSGSTIWLNIKI